MSIPTKITRQDLVIAAARRFHHSYKAWWDPAKRQPSFLKGRTCQEVHGDLKRATTISEVEALVGPSWTRLTCHNCQREVEQVAELNSHAQDEYGPCNYCADCLWDALTVLEGK
jgi:hypothetical protein